MEYEQPLISTLGSAQLVVQGVSHSKTSGTCKDSDNANGGSSTGAYEMDE
jgi:hypothetical protein